MAAAMTATLVATHVTKRYPNIVAVRDVSCELAGGEVLAIIGPNGAGKTTLFSVVAGEQRPTGGRVEAFGQDVTGWSASRRARLGIARTFQVSRFFPDSTVWENVAVAVDAADGSWLRGWNRFDGRRLPVRQRADAALAEAGLTALSGVPATSLSHGDKKRLELAMALAQQPALLLLDEPTAGMSYQDAQATIELLNNIHAERPGLSMLITAHDMEVVFGTASRVLLMSDGQIVLSGSPAEVAADEKTISLYLGQEWRRDVTAPDD
jgi:branched-chain amino acid transport system ATP-binding protein